MRIHMLRNCICLCALHAFFVGCNRKTYQANEYNAPLTTPVPVAEGDYSNPAASTPAQVAPINQDSKVPDDETVEQNSLPGYHSHCPPPGTTPPSADVVKEGSSIEAIDCPPGDPNAASSRMGLPGTPAESEEGALNR